MKSSDIEKTKSSSVVCMGREYPYDHPKVYLEIDESEGEILCPYCSRKFVLTAN
jgi:uncharacterized Zn-finger protein